jgi:hypothetical protein
MIENEKRGERTVTVDQGASNCHAISETASMSIRPIRPISGLEQNQTRGNNVVITACGEPATSGCTIAVPSRYFIPGKDEDLDRNTQNGHNQCENIMMWRFALKSPVTAIRQHMDFRTAGFLSLLQRHCAGPRLFPKLAVRMN